jgi:hypothetical protein
MLVGAFSGQDFIADDDEADCHGRVPIFENARPLHVTCRRQLAAIRAVR